MKLKLYTQDHKTFMDIQGHVGDVNELFTSEDGESIYLCWSVRDKPIETNYLSPKEGIITELWKYPEPIYNVIDTLRTFSKSKKALSLRNDALVGMFFTIGLEYYQITKFQIKEHDAEMEWFIEGEWIGNVDSGPQFEP